jgi:hypothetical protein
MEAKMPMAPGSQIPLVPFTHCQSTSMYLKSVHSGKSMRSGNKKTWILILFVPFISRLAK